ncbi:hypothetical protein IJF81_05450 [bacterium]|nr:hypothetical protein [bacterium]
MDSVFLLIVKSNFFNFTIFLLMLIFIAKKFDLPNILEDMKMNIVKKIEDSKASRTLSDEELSKAENSVAKLGDEVEEIISDANKSAKNFVSNIEISTKLKIKNIEKNAKRLIEAQESNINSKLTSKQGQASVKLAKDHIRSVINSNPNLHNKFIEESIKDIEESKLWD